MSVDIDLQKVADMRDAHERRHADYRSLAARARDAQAEAGRARAELLHGDPLVENPFARASADELELTPLDELEKAGIELRAVRTLVLTERRAKALAQQAQRAAEELRHGRELLDSIETYLRELGVQA